MLHEHKRNEVAMSKYVKLEDIQAYPIRLDRCDIKNGNINIERRVEYGRVIKCSRYSGKI